MWGERKKERKNGNKLETKVVGMLNKTLGKRGLIRERKIAKLWSMKKKEMKQYEWIWYERMNMTLVCFCVLMEIVFASNFIMGSTPFFYGSFWTCIDRPTKDNWVPLLVNTKLSDYIFGSYFVKVSNHKNLIYILIK